MCNSKLEASATHQGISSAEILVQRMIKMLSKRELCARGDSVLAKAKYSAKKRMAAAISTCAGIAFIRRSRVAFKGTASCGQGVVISRLPDGSWSAPTGFGMGTVGVGFSFGISYSCSIVILPTAKSLEMFYNDFSFGIGIESEFAFLKCGGSSAAKIHVAPATGDVGLYYSCSWSSGLFFGVHIELQGWFTRTSMNQDYFGVIIPSRDILKTACLRTEAVEKLHVLLNQLVCISKSFETCPSHDAGASAHAHAGTQLTSVQTEPVHGVVVHEKSPEWTSSSSLVLQGTAHVQALTIPQAYPVPPSSPATTSTSTHPSAQHVHVPTTNIVAGQVVQSVSV